MGNIINSKNQEENFKMEVEMEFINKDLKRKMFLVLFGIFSGWIFFNINLVGKYLGILLSALAPLIIGLIIAFILNKPMMFFERKIFRKSKMKSKYKRILSLLLTLLVFLILIGLFFLIVIPNLLEVSMELGDKFPSYMEAIDKYIGDSSIKHSKLNQWIQSIDLKEVRENISNFIKGGLMGWLTSSFVLAGSVFGGLISFLIGIIFSIYFLLDKDSLMEANKRLFQVILPRKTFNKTLYISRLTSKAFSDFILAQSLEAVILGAIFFISMSLFKFPYAGMISVVIAVFSFIPMVGSFVGLFVGIILIFVESPQLAGWFIILFLVLQQIEGNLIYPRVVGKLSGLSPLLTLAAVTLGGSLMGIVGMLLFVPIFSVIQKLTTDYIKNAPGLEN